MSLKREQLKERLLGAELPEDVVEAFLSDLDDDDLARMKEDITAEQLVAALKDAAKEPDTEPETEPTPDTEDTGDVEALTEVFKGLEDRIVQRVTDQLETLQVEVEAPQLAEVIETVQAMKEHIEAQATALKEMQEAWKEILKGDSQRLKEMYENLSQRQRTRLHATLLAEQRVADFKEDKEKEVDDSGGLTQKDAKDIFHAQVDPGPRPVIRDSQGREYRDLGAFAMGNPIE